MGSGLPINAHSMFYYSLTLIKSNSLCLFFYAFKSFIIVIPFLWFQKHKQVFHLLRPPWKYSLGPYRTPEICLKVKFTGLSRYKSKKTTLFYEESTVIETLSIWQLLLKSELIDWTDLKIWKIVFQSAQVTFVHDVLFYDVYSCTEHPIDDQSRD